MRPQTDSREKLLTTAVDLIWQSNYAMVGVNEICAAAGVTKGCFYHYFTSKAELYYAACMHHWDEMKPTLDAVFSPSISPLEQLESLIQLVLKKQEDRAPAEGNPVSGCPIFISGGQAGIGEELVRQVAVELTAKGIAYHASLIRNLHAIGALNSKPDIAQLARLMHQYIQGLLLYARIQASLDVIRTDLREGIYRLLDLKSEHRK